MFTDCIIFQMVLLGDCVPILLYVKVQTMIAQTIFVCVILGMLMIMESVLKVMYKKYLYKDRNEIRIENEIHTILTNLNAYLCECGLSGLHKSILILYSVLSGLSDSLLILRSQV